MDLNTLRNRKGSPDYFGTICCPPHCSFVQCSSVISGFSAPQGLKEAVTALCLDNCPSLSSRLTFQGLKGLVTFTCHFEVEIYKGLYIYKQSPNVYESLSLCLCFNIVWIYFTQTQSRKYFHLIYLVVKFSLTYKRRYYIVSFDFPHPNSTSKLLLLPRDRVRSWGWGWGAEIKKEWKPALQGEGGGTVWESQEHLYFPF